MANRNLKVKPTDIIRIESENAKALARQFGVSVQSVRAALRGATRSGNAPLIREAAMNYFNFHIAK